jgi:hypothetical protein
VMSMLLGLRPTSEGDCARAGHVSISAAMNKPIQRAMYCPCGQEKILARGLCATCYTLKRQDSACSCGGF